MPPKKAHALLANPIPNYHFFPPVFKVGWVSEKAVPGLKVPSIPGVPTRCRSSMGTGWCLGMVGTGVCHQAVTNLQNKRSHKSKLVCSLL